MSERDELNSEVSQIADCVEETLFLLKEVVATYNLAERRASMVNSRLSRLKAWASSTGLHHFSEDHSLAQILQDAPAVQSHVLSLLEDLLSSAYQLRSAASDSDPTKEVENNREQSSVKALAEIDLELASFFSGSALQSNFEWDAALDQIDHIIGCLMRLSVTFRSLGSLERYSHHCDITFENQFYRVDADHARSEYPQADPIIWDRLAIASVRRRAFLKYQEGNIKLPVKDSGSVDESKTAVSHSGLTTTETPRPKQSNDFSDSIQSDDFSDTSGTSYKASPRHDEELFMLHPPGEAWRVPFSCPLCYTMISIEEYATWKRHVLEDLKPYVCLALNCPTPYTLYKKRSQWENHMRKEHWKYFTCPDCYSESVFLTLDTLCTHAFSAHGQNISPENMKALYDITIRYDDFKAMNDCPLCLEVKISSGQHYIEHVGNHLELLAFVALPNENDKTYPGFRRSKKRNFSQVNLRDKDIRRGAQKKEETSAYTSSDGEENVSKTKTTQNDSENPSESSEPPIASTSRNLPALRHLFDYMTNWRKRLQMTGDEAKCWTEIASESDLGGNSAESSTVAASKSARQTAPPRLLRQLKDLLNSTQSGPK